MGGEAAERDDVRVGAHPGALPGDGLARLQPLLVEEAKVATSPGVGFGREATATSASP